MIGEELASALASEDVEARRAAVLELRDIKDPELGTWLMRALGDQHWRVREEAVSIAAELAIELHLVRPLIEAICQGNNVGLRNAAREVLQVLGAAAAPTLLATLPEVAPESRKFLLDALASGGATAAHGVIDALVAAMHGGDSMTAISAMDALAQLGGPRAEAALRKKLVQADTFESAAALDALEQLGVALRWEEVAPLLTDRILRRVALSALGRTGDPRALPYLLAALSDRSTRVQLRGLLGLQRLRGSVAAIRSTLPDELRRQPPELIERLRSFAREQDMVAALAACELLACLQDQGAVHGSLQLLSHGAPPSDVLSVFAGWQSAALPAVLAAISEPNSARASAIDLASALLLELRPLTAEPAVFTNMAAPLLAILQVAVSDEDLAVRVAAVRALGTLGDASHMAALLGRTSSGDDDLASAAVAALRELALRDLAASRTVLADVVIAGPAAAALCELLVDFIGAEALPRLRDALLSAEPVCRVAALAGLSRLGGDRACELVVLALHDEHPEVQVAAIDALQRMPADAARGVDALLLFDSADADVQAALARALAALADPRALERLRKLARSAPAGVRLFAIAGLLALHDESLADLLIESLGDADYEVVKQALRGLAATGGTRATARIAIALEHPAWDVRQLAASLLGESGDATSLPALDARLPTEPDALVRLAIEEARDALSEAR